MRRQHKDVIPGQVYCVDWPEWHVECATPGCDECDLLAPSGEAFTVKDAERQYKKNTENMVKKWRKKNGLWYCPTCSIK